MLPTPIGRPGPAIGERRSADIGHSSIWALSLRLGDLGQDACRALVTASTLRGLMNRDISPPERRLASSSFVNTCQSLRRRGSALRGADLSHLAGALAPCHTE